MALAKTIKKKPQLKKKISTEAIRHSYMYRQIAMNRDIEQAQSDLGTEQHSVDAQKLRNASIEEVLLLEAT